MVCVIHGFAVILSSRFDNCSTGTFILITSEYLLKKESNILLGFKSD